MVVLILTADVGHGHLAAGRAVAEDLRRIGAEPREVDGLAALGPVVRHLVRDGYRFQLRVAPWSFHAMYGLFTKVPWLPRLGGCVLGATGRRRLRRLVAEHGADVLVSTHPAITAALGRMRLRGELDLPVCVTVTDLADYGVWCHRGADVHLVMHPSMLAEVERIAGAGSAVLARPFVPAALLRPRDPLSARRALGLPARGRIVAVSGGGWGVGDLGGAVAAALVAGATDVVVVAGANERAHADLLARFGDDRRVRVWGFTDRMPELLAAADVLVHSTGGMTSLEAAAAGCPLIAYGSDIGHIRVHNAALTRLGLMSAAASAGKLATVLRLQLEAPPAAAPRLGSAGRAPGEIVAAARARVRPMPAWRLAAGRMAVPAAAIAFAGAGLTTDEAYSLVSRPLELAAAHRIVTSRPLAAVVVHGAGDAAPAVARRLAQRGVHVSFTTAEAPAPGVVTTLRATRDDVIPLLGGTTPVRWTRTKGLLAAAPTDGTHRLFVADADGLSLGQDLLARALHGRPLAPAVSVSGAQALPALEAGDVVRVDVAPSPGVATAEIVAVTRALSVRGLRSVPVSALVEASTPPRSSAAAEPTTSSIAAAVTSHDAAS